MISTITTSTVSTVTTVNLAASLTLLGVLALLFLLIQKELAAEAGRVAVQTYAKILDIAITPLLLTFVFIVIVKVSEVLR